MKIGIDLDGTITRVALYNPNIRLPWWLFWLLAFPISALGPNKLVIEKLQTMREQGCKIIIITARPIQLEKLTRKWLVSNHVPFDELFCVGFGKGTKERKLKIIRGKDVAIYIDGDKGCRDFLERNSVKAVASIGQFK